MIGPSYAFSSSQSNSAPRQLAGNRCSVCRRLSYDRGSATIDALRGTSRVISELRYCPDDQCIYLNGQPTKRSRLAEHMDGASRILIDVTTLGLGEILNILMAAQTSRRPEVGFCMRNRGSI